MELTRNTGRRWQHPHKITVTCFRVFLGAILLSFFGISSAFGQNTYSDLWADRLPSEEVDPENGSVRIFGDGITDGSYTHKYYVDTVLSTPVSSNIFSSSGIRTAYARAESLFQRDLSQAFEGDVSVESEHFARCPGDDLNFYSVGSTFFAGRIGYFRQTYIYRHFIQEQGVHWYSINCIGPCTSVYLQNRYFSQYRGPYYVCNGIRISFLGTSCIGRCNGSPVDMGCF